MKKTSHSLLSKRGPFPHYRSDSGLLTLTISEKSHNGGVLEICLLVRQVNAELILWHTWLYPKNPNVRALCDRIRNFDDLPTNVFGTSELRRTRMICQDGVVPLYVNRRFPQWWGVARA